MLTQFGLSNVSNFQNGLFYIFFSQIFVTYAENSRNPSLALCDRLDSDQIFLPFRENRMTVVSLPFFFIPFLDIAKLTYFSTRWQKYLGSK